MKSCPVCKNQYSDDTLLYCLQDRTPLTAVAQNDTPTVMLGETETAAARDRNLLINAPVNDPNQSAWQQSEVTRIATASPEKRSSKTALTVILTMLGMLVLFGVIAFGAWIFFRNSQQTTAQNTANTSNTTKPLSPSTGDALEIQNEVSQCVQDWKSKLESRDFNGYMSHYAPTVDYYTKRGVSSSTIRADKARAFSLYNSMRVNVSNLSVTNASGDIATATFDKEWVFDGSKSSAGKTQSQLELKKVNGQWLITAERDLKLYYKR